MGMGSIPAHATIITESFILTSLPTAGPILKEIRQYMDEHDICESVLDSDNGDVYWEIGGWEGDEDEGKQHEDWLDSQMANFSEAFTKDTGLKVYPFYYNEDEGDRYDDLPESGVYWTVAGVYEMTPAAKRIQAGLQDVMWTVYG
jgi:hypothetical protein